MFIHLETQNERISLNVNEIAKIVYPKTPLIYIEADIDDPSFWEGIDFDFKVDNNDGTQNRYYSNGLRFHIQSWKNSQLKSSEDFSRSYIPENVIQVLKKEHVDILARVQANTATCTIYTKGGDKIHPLNPVDEILASLMATN